MFQDSPQVPHILHFLCPGSGSHSLPSILTSSSTLLVKLEPAFLGSGSQNVCCSCSSSITESFLVSSQGDTVGALFEKLPVPVATTFIWRLCPQGARQAIIILCSFPRNPKSVDPAQRHSLCNSGATGSCMFGRQRKEN